MKKIENTIKDILCMILKVQRKRINFRFSFKNTKNWDSLNHVKIIMALDSAFKIKIEPDQAVDMISYKKILQYIKKII
jgi:acyl carrier protein